MISSDFLDIGGFIVSKAVTQKLQILLMERILACVGRSRADMAVWRLVVRILHDVIQNLTSLVVL